MSNIKKAFTSRFPNGKIIEVDWNQLEINILQVLSGDKNLAKELIDGIDLHTAMTAKIYGYSYATVEKLIAAKNPDWIRKRKITKSARFALQYGASAKKISSLTGWTESFSSNFIKEYYLHYPLIKQWIDKVKKEVKDSSRPSKSVGDIGIYKGQYTCPSGRRYVFKGVYDDTFKRVKYSPNQLMNYPVQGLASDFVKVMGVQLLLKIYAESLDKGILLVNTVHDSIILDVKQELIEAANIECITGVYRYGAEILGNMLDRKVEIPFRYSVTTHSHW